MNLVKKGLFVNLNCWSDLRLFGIFLIILINIIRDELLFKFFFVINFVNYIDKIDFMVSEIMILNFNFKF